MTPEIRDFFVAFRQAVIDGDRQAVAARIRYPIVVDLDGKVDQKVTIRTERQFLDKYDRIMLDGVRRVIARSGVNDLASTKYGPVRLYRGQLFIYHACAKLPDEEPCEDGPIRVLSIANTPWLAE